MGDVNSTKIQPSEGGQINPKPMVIGIYGISGSGKSLLLERLRQTPGFKEFLFFEGSDKIASLVDGGLEGFLELDEQGKSHLRKLAIDAIRQECSDRGRPAIVTGHFSFWEDQCASVRAVHTPNDLATFTHIIYLGISTDVISQWRLSDGQRNRLVLSAEHLFHWQRQEISQMRNLCLEHRILFSLVSKPENMLSQVTKMILYFQQHHTIEANMIYVKAKVDELFCLSGSGTPKTVLVMDGDKTLAAQDTGTLFWEQVSRDRGDLAARSPLQELFGSALGYSDTAFHQATLLYEDATDDEQFENMCHEVALKVVMYPELVALLQLPKTHSHVGAMVVTCGLGRVWEKVLDRYKLAERVQVIGGGRLSDRLIVTPAVKAAIVSQLQDASVFVWAFGDSPLDLPMLQQADQGIVVVGDKQFRSSSMDAALAKAIENSTLRVRQALLPGYATPRLDVDRLPLINLNDQQLAESIALKRRSIELLHATESPAAKLLMSPTRDASNNGPALREAHMAVGKHLAIEFLSRLIGLEEYLMPHVQGHQTAGHRLNNEQQTSIVALMRGGEAIAFGINEIFPKAMFIHATSPQDIGEHHILNQSTVLLVDSVVNSGRTILEFMEHIRGLHATVRVIVVSVVVQAEVIGTNHPLRKAMNYHQFDLVALRVSENKFTGTKGLDTGNRLFNTTHLD